MTWVNLSSAFGFNTTLTSTQMQNLRDNITALANGDSGAPQIQNAALQDGCVYEETLAVNSVSTGKIVDGAVLANKIGTGQVTLAKMANDSVGSNQYVDGSILEAHIGTAQITNSKMATNSINSSNIIDGAVGSDEIANSSVIATKIGSRQVTLDKMPVAVCQLVVDHNSGTEFSNDSGSWGVMTPEAALRFYKPSGATSLAVSLRVKRTSSSNNHHFRINIDSTNYSSGVASNATSYSYITDSIDISGLSDGWHSISIETYDDNPPGRGYLQGWTIYLG